MIISKNRRLFKAFITTYGDYIGALEQRDSQDKRLSGLFGFLDEEDAREEDAVDVVGPRQRYDKARTSLLDHLKAKKDTKKLEILEVISTTSNGHDAAAAWKNLRISFDPWYVRVFRGFTST